MDWTHIKHSFKRREFDSGHWTLRLPATIVLDFIRRRRRYS
jgi:hypothetical protein